ncbi:Uncharacterised protein [Klebsiella pneumoniae]|nr:hypothetical protein L386_01314 [Klebsiella variicola]SWP65049.1 Uncharacterised protein [Klebsiella pneumoniae]
MLACIILILLVFNFSLSYIFDFIDFIFTFVVLDRLSTHIYFEVVMKTFFAVWDVYSENWGLIEKGNHLFRACDADELMEEMDAFCEVVAENRGIDSSHVVITSCQSISFQN